MCVCFLLFHIATTDIWKGGRLYPVLKHRLLFILEKSMGIAKSDIHARASNNIIDSLVVLTL